MVTRDLTRLKHMLDAAQAILTFQKGKTRKHLDTDEQFFFAVARGLEIIGEAAVAVSPEFKQKFPEIPWKEMINMRNRLIHAYFDVNTDIVWMTISEAVPTLLDQLKVAISKYQA